MQPAHSTDKQQLHDLVEELADQLCPAVDGVFDFSVKTSAHDESIDKLQMLINLVLDAARRSLSDLSEKNASLRTAHDRVRETVSELEDFNKAAVDRELRMIELKTEINGLSVELGRGALYDVSFDDSEHMVQEPSMDESLDNAQATEEA